MKTTQLIMLTLLHKVKWVSDPNAQIDLSENPELAQKMVGAMIKMEGGTSAYDYFADSVAIKGGLDMAYGK